MKLGKYKHHKGNVYQVITVGVHEETLEELVVYKDSEHVWIRPLKVFLENVTLPDGKVVKRFDLVENS